MDNNYQHTLGLNSIINMTFTWFNVKPGYDNQLIRYSSNNVNTFQDVWTCCDFDAYIKQITENDDICL